MWFLNAVNWVLRGWVVELFVLFCGNKKNALKTPDFLNWLDSFFRSKASVFLMALYPLFTSEVNKLERFQPRFKKYRARRSHSNRFIKLNLTACFGNVRLHILVQILSIRRHPMNRSFGEKIQICLDETVQLFCGISKPLEYLWNEERIL
jgi:hypothetical protein